MDKRQRQIKSELTLFPEVKQREEEHRKKTETTEF
jgi:hypothetical protein